MSKRTLLIYFLIPFFLISQYRRTQGLKGQNSMLLCQAIKWHIWRSGASPCYTPTWAEILRIPFSKRPPHPSHKTGMGTNIYFSKHNTWGVQHEAPLCRQSHHHWFYDEVLRGSIWMLPRLARRMPSPRKCLYEVCQWACTLALTKSSIPDVA